MYNDGILTAVNISADCIIGTLVDLVFVKWPLANIQLEWLAMLLSILCGLLVLVTAPVLPGEVATRH